MTDRTRGWSGTMGQVLHFLETVGADKDGDGNFLIANAGVYSFLGMKGRDVDVIVPGNATYFKEGVPCNLANGLGKTSYGARVVVICNG